MGVRVGVFKVGCESKSVSLYVRLWGSGWGWCEGC